MNIVHLLIGIVLLIIGLVTTGFLLYYIVSKKEKSPNVILSISEALATFVLGALFISCHVSLSELNIDFEMTENGTNTTEDSLGLETTNSIINETQTADLRMKELYDDKRFYPIGEAEVVLEDNQSVSVDAKQESTVDNFLKNYQHLIKDMLNKRKSTNKTTAVYYNNKLLVNQLPDRIAKQLELNETNLQDVGDGDKFYKEGILFYSFAYCLVSLIVGTIHCSQCKNTLVEKEAITIVKSIKNESDDGSDAAPTTPSPTKDSTIHPLQLIIMLVSKWLFPIICVLILYALMPEKPSSKPIISPIFNDPSHSAMMDAIRTHINISIPESKDLNNVISQIYEIVTKANENYTVPANITYPPIMYEIVNYFNNRNRQRRQLLPRNSMENDQRPLAVKVEAFMLFVIAYFGAVYYAKVKQLQLELDNVERGTLATRIHSFLGLWLPAALETCVRMYFVSAEPNLLSDLLLAFGNLNRIVSNIINVHQIRAYAKNTNAILPVTT